MSEVETYIGTGTLPMIGGKVFRSVEEREKLEAEALSNSDPILKDPPASVLRHIEPYIFKGKEPGWENKLKEAVKNGQVIQGSLDLEVALVIAKASEELHLVEMLKARQTITKIEESIKNVEY